MKGLGKRVWYIVYIFSGSDKGSSVDILFELALSLVGTKSARSLNTDTLGSSVSWGRGIRFAFTYCRERVGPASFPPCWFQCFIVIPFHWSFLIKSKKELPLLIISTPPEEQFCSINTLHKLISSIFGTSSHGALAMHAWSGRAMSVRHVPPHFLPYHFPLPPHAFNKR